MAQEYLGTTHSYITVIQGGAPDWINYTQVRKMAGTAYPGRVVTTHGQTDKQVVVASATDGQDGSIEVVLQRVACVPQDIDTAITTGQYVLTLRKSGGRFLVAIWRADESTSLKRGVPLSLEADGMLEEYVGGTDVDEDFVGRLAQESADVASTDLVELIWL